MSAPISYDRYTELLGKRIHRTITPAEVADVTRFEAAQPQTCPNCGAKVRSYFLPTQIVHDLATCPPNPTP